MTINRCMAMLLSDLEEEGIPQPLVLSSTLAAVWEDLARFAGENRA